MEAAIATAATAVRLALLACLALAAARPGAAAGPSPFVVEAPPALAEEAAAIRTLDASFLAPAVELTGIAAIPRMRVVLEPEGTPLARRVPPHISGFAEGSTALVVLFPARAAYPDASLFALLQHEACHVLLARASRHRVVPRWFDEGLALAAGREWGVGDRTRFGLAVLKARGTSPRELDSLFRGSPEDVRAAYAVAGALMRDLLERHGPRFPARLLALVGADVDFDVAYRQVTRTPLEVDVDAFWARHRSLEAWIPLLTSSTVLWAGITLLALWAIRVRRRRHAERLAALAAEEEAEAEAGQPALAEEPDERPFGDGPVN